jgi:TrmH family RNA methyltransferase
MSERVLITSFSNPQVKDVVRLRTGKHRRRKEHFLIDGVREISRAIVSKIEIVRVFIEQDYFSQKTNNTDFEKDRLREQLQELDRRGCVWEVTHEVFLKMTFGERNEGVIAVAESPIRDLVDVVLPDVPLICVLEGIEKPGNIGAVFRSADGAGLDAVIVAQPETDLFNPGTVRASLGTVFPMLSAVTSTEEVLLWLRSQNLQIVAARCDGAVPHDTIDLTLPTAIVMGCESAGLTELWNAPDIRAVKIPMLGLADSLNISNAADILFYEARRQRSGLIKKRDGCRERNER